MTEEEAYHQLSLYTLQKGDSKFIHQYIVDAYAAQHPAEGSKLIRVYFALAGLYLHIEKGFTGRQVQLAHMQMAKSGRKTWPTFVPPATLGDMTVIDVLKCPEGPIRDDAITQWSKSVWKAWHEQHQSIGSLLSNDFHLQ
jgi:hypothetical protein